MQELELRNITGCGISALAAATQLTGLTALRLSKFSGEPTTGAPIDFGGATPAPAADRDASAHRDRDDLGGDLVICLSSAPWFLNLNDLALQEGGLTDVSAVRLADVPFRRLVRLRLDRNSITAAGAAALAQAPWMASSVQVGCAIVAYKHLLVVYQTTC